MKNKSHPLARLAKEAVENYVLRGETIEPPPWIEKDHCQKRAGVFVSIKQNGELRGCIGTYTPTNDNIASEVIANAIAAASEDPRFDAITKNDLSRLDYEVYVLRDPEPIRSLDELDPKKYGVLVIGDSSKRSGLLLPGLEGIEVIEQQLSIACDKAGIDIRNEKIAVYRFGADKYCF